MKLFAKLGFCNNQGDVHDDNSSISSDTYEDAVADESCEESIRQNKMETCSTSSTLETSTTSTGTGLDKEVERDIGPPTPIVTMKKDPENGDNPRPSLLKSVCFNLRRNEYFHNHEPRRTTTQSLRCWYNEADISLFRQNSSKAAVRLLGTKQKRQRKESSNTKVDERFAASAHAFKQSIAEAYQRSNEIRTEEAFDEGLCPIDLENLKNAYQRFDREHGLCLIGLEVYFMYGIRGESATQTKYILDTVKQRMRSLSKVRNINRFPEHRDNLMRLMSQYISLPSRVFVRELARAQAAALEAEIKMELHQTQEQRQ
ncbi:hypothetical protein ACA910_008305 [Epithemia clementina (nom. ined.)]